MGGGPIAAMLAQSNFGRSTTIRELPGRRCDLQVLARDKYLCQYCLKKGLSTPATEVDHVAEIQDGGDEFDEPQEYMCQNRQIGERFRGILFATILHC